MQRPFHRIEIQGTLESRFWNKVCKSLDGCWVWTGYKDNHGYGRIRLAGKGSPMVLASRVSWVMHHEGAINSLLICHSCDNPACVRPSHLFSGTYADNNADMKSKDRHTRGARSGTAKLSEDEAKKIISEYTDKQISMKNLGKKYGIGAMQVHRIITGKRWEYLGGGNS